MEAGYLLSFTTGLLGGFGHCIGMCGPVVSSYYLYSEPQGASPRSTARQISSLILFNAGRISTYSFIGALAGLTGSFVNTAGRLAGLQNIISVIAGAFMIWMGLGIVGIFRTGSRLEQRGGLILKGVGAVIEGEGMWRFYPVGLLLGLLPCGLSYSVFIGAAGSGGMLQGMVFSLLFGLGTVPAMLLVGSISLVAGRKVRGLIYRAGGIAVIALGILFVIRGIRAIAAV
ncbi:MAG: sulfite exporter TauE/SafE family protein [Nitrospiraceae bacterium]|nr:sulfite exporter TauE/SafE family protein [Nitrospiraceae bacterium]